MCDWGERNDQQKGRGWGGHCRGHPEGRRAGDTSESTPIPQDHTEAEIQRVRVNSTRITDDKSTHPDSQEVNLSRITDSELTHPKAQDVTFIQDHR